MQRVYINDSNKTQRWPLRWAYLGFGSLCIGLGTLGMFLPVMPSTIFFILALWAFKKSSPRLEYWLLQHPVMGPTLRDWEQNRAIKRKTKVVAITMIWACMILSIAISRKLTVAVILGTVGAFLTAYIWTRNTAPELGQPSVQ